MPAAVKATDPVGLTLQATLDASAENVTGLPDPPPSDAGQFWYVPSCIAFRAGYFAKIPRKKALSELAHIHEAVIPPANGNTLIAGQPA